MRKNQKGQAAIEMALSLPLIIWLIYYTLNSYFVLRTAQVGQKYAAMSLHQRLDHRAIFVVDPIKKRLANRNFLAVQYRNIDGNATPKRRIVRQAVEIDTVVGICREPRCD